MGLLDDGPGAGTCYDSDEGPGPDLGVDTFDIDEVVLNPEDAVADETEEECCFTCQHLAASLAEAKERSTRALDKAAEMLEAAEEAVRKHNNVEAADRYMALGDRWLHVAHMVSP